MYDDILNGISFESLKVKSVISFVIDGEPASKANSRIISMRAGRIFNVKSQKALSYLANFRQNCPVINPLLTGAVKVDIVIRYASWRPDLDESLILDAMQGLIYVNDRQVVWKNVVRGLSSPSPRCAINVSSVEGFPMPNDRRPKLQAKKERQTGDNVSA
jgi:Holliday junction resolvase RusA-like endonuclease